MNSRNGILILLALCVAGAVFWAARSERKSANAPATPVTPAPKAPAAATGQARAPVPPFYASVEAAKPLTQTLAPERFHIPVVAKAYRVAREIPEVLAQQPCYCWCDKFGHASLLDCFATEHGAG